jgi:hypothetical protein
MNALSAAEIAQCATCSGVLVPAGDDWRHQEPAPECTDFGVPVPCRVCAMPAVVGALACAPHAGVSARVGYVRSQ